MSVSDALGERRTVEVPAGTIEFRRRGSGRPVVFVHGVGVNGDLWRDVVPRLDGAWSVRFKAVQRLPTAYGWTTRRPMPETVMRSYTEPVRTNAGVRRDLMRLLRAVDTRYTHEAAESLRGFDKPALVVWAADDKLFPLEHGRRLAELLPQGRFEIVPDSRTFIPEEQPERLAAILREFLVRGESG